jgi:hypothetical protein
MRAVLATVILVVPLTGCGSGSGDSTPPPSIEEQKQMSVQERTERAKQDLLPPSQLGIDRKKPQPAGAAK